MPEPIPGKLALSPAEEEVGWGTSRNFPTSLAPVSRAAAPRDPSSPPTPPSDRAAGSRRPAAAPGHRELPGGKVSSLRRGSHHGGPGLGARRARALGELRLLRLPSRAPAAATAEAALRPVPPAFARPTPGPHWQRQSPPSRVFRKAPSLGAPAGAAPPAPLPTRAAGLGDPLGRGKPTFRPAPSLRPLPAWSLRGDGGWPSFPGEGCSPGASPGPLWDRTRSMVSRPLPLF